MEKVQVKFGDWIEQGFNLYKANFGPLVLASLIMVLLSGVTLGILSGPMFAGLVIITLELLDKKGAQAFRRNGIQRIRLFFEFLSLCYRVGIGADDCINTHRTHSLHRTTGGDLFSLCGPGIFDVRHVFDRG